MDENPWNRRAMILLACAALLLLIVVIVEISTSSWATGLPLQR